MIGGFLLPSAYPMYKSDTSASPDFDTAFDAADANAVIAREGSAASVASVRGAPRLLGSSHTEGGPFNPLGATVALYFNEPVARGNGTIYITDGVAQTVIDRVSGKPVMRIAGATDTHVISASDAGKVSIVNGAVQIKAGNLVEGKNYSVLVTKGAFIDLDGNAFAGIATSATLNFRTSDAAPLATISLDQTLLGVGETATVTVTFSEAIFALSEYDFLVSSGELGSFSSNADRTVWTATFTPATGVQDLTNLITLPGSAFRDLAGNYGSGSFSSANYIVDMRAPVMTSMATRIGVDTSAPITITFDEAVYWEDASTISLTGGGVTTTIDRSKVSFSLDHTAMTIPASALKLAPNTIYTLTLPASFGDQTGNAPTGKTVTLNTNPSTVPAPSTLLLHPDSDTSAYTYLDDQTTDATPTFLVAGLYSYGKIRLYDNGVFVAETSVLGETVAEITAPSRGYGVHVFTVTNVDGQGNESLPSALERVEITDVLIDIDPAGGTLLRSGNTVEVTFTFASPVANLNAGAFKVGNGTLTGFSGSGTVWKAVLTPAAGVDAAVNTIELIGANLSFSDDTRPTFDSYTSRSYQVDTVVEAHVDPVMTIVDNGRSGSDGITSATLQTISGTYHGELKAGESIQLFVNGGQHSATVDPATHSWTWSGEISEGGKYAAAWVSNGSHGSALATRSFTVDTTGPRSEDGTSFAIVDETEDFTLYFDDELYWTDDSTLTFQGNGQTLSFTKAQLEFSEGASWLTIPAALHAMVLDKTYTITMPSGLSDAAGNHAGETFTLSTVTDSEAPRALAAYVQSAPGDYGIGDTITIVVRFSEAVRADGEPALVFNVGGGEGSALFDSGNGTTDLVFHYVVQPGDYANVLTLASTDLVGQVSDMAGNPVAAGGVGFNVVTRAGGGTIGIAIDGQAPDAPGAPDLVAASDTGVSSSDNITADNTPTFSGSGADAGALVHLWMDGEFVGMDTADLDGNFTITPLAPLEDGAHAFTFVQFDSLLNPSEESAGLDVVIDTPDPVIAASTSGSGSALSITFDDAIRFTSGTIEVRDASDVVVRTIAPGDTALWSISGSTLILPAAGLTDGTYSVKLSADAVQDVAGNFTVELVGTALGQGWLVGVTA